MLLPEKTGLSKYNLILPAAGFAILVILLRIPYLYAQPAAMDEPFTLYWAQKSVSEIFSLAYNENNPPLHFLILHYWMKIFGTSAFSWRMPSLLFSVLLVFIAVYQVSKKSIWAAIILGVLFTFSNQHIAFSMEARAYTLLAFLTMLALGATLNGSQNKPFRLYQLAVISALLIYSHYLSVWVLACILLSLIIDKSLFKFPKQSFAAFLLFIVLIAPLLLPAWQRIGHMKETGTWVPEPVITQIYGHINLMWNGAIVTILAGAAGLTALAANRKNIIPFISKRSVSVPLMWFLIIYFGLYFQSILFQPVFIPRYLFFASVPLFVFTAMLADEAAAVVKKSWIFPILFLVSLFPGIHFKPSNHRDMRLLVERTAEIRHNEPLLVCPSHATLAYLCNAYPQLFFSGKNESEMNELNRIYPINSFAEIPDSLLNKPALVYMDADAAFTLPENGIEAGLEQHFQEVEIIRVPEIYTISRWEK